MRKRKSSYGYTKEKRRPVYPVFEPKVLRAT